MAISIYVDIKNKSTRKPLFVEAGEVTPGKMIEFPETLEIDENEEYELTTTYSMTGTELKNFIYPKNKPCPKKQFTQEEVIKIDSTSQAAESTTEKEMLNVEENENEGPNTN